MLHRLPVAATESECPTAERLRATLHAAADALADLLTEIGTTTANKAAPDRERLLTAAEVAARTGLSLDYVYRHARRWPFARKIGRASRFSESGLERWLASRRPSP